MRIQTLAWRAAQGVIGAYVGMKAMDPITNVLYERESEEARKKEDKARGGQAAYEIAVSKLARLFGKSLSDEQIKSLGLGVHNLLGISAGVLYAFLRKRYPGARRAGGLLYGTSFFLIVDEGLNTFLGITPPPQAFPWQAHARGAIAHLAFGSASEAALKLTDLAEERAVSQLAPFRSEFAA